MKQTNGLAELRKNTVLRKLIAGFIFAFAFYGAMKIFFEPSIVAVLQNFKFFTNISNFLIAVAILLYFFDLQDKKWYQYLALIALVNIMITGIIYHTLVSGLSNFFTLTFDSQIKHTLNPILYPVFYFLLVTPSVKISKFWVTLVFPLAYFLFFMIFAQQISAPYGFMDPYAPGNSILSVLALCLLGLLPVIALFTIGVMKLKDMLENKVNQQS